MEGTRALASVAKIPDLHNHAPSSSSADSAPKPETGQSAGPERPSDPLSARRDAGQWVSREDLDAAIVQIKDYVQSIQRTLSFSVDDDTGRTVIKVMDSKTEQVIRQIPPEEVLLMLQHIADSTQDGRQDHQGLFVREKA